jgi:hypothetical protein
MSSPASGPGFVAPDTDKEIVVYRGGWGFRPPEQHTIRINEPDRLVDLSMPQRGGTYSLERVEETDDEYRVYVAPGGPFSGHAIGDLPAEYPFPTIDEEIDRLRIAWLNAGLRETDFNAWGQGASWDSHTTWLRARFTDGRPMTRGRLATSVQGASAG